MAAVVALDEGFVASVAVVAEAAEVVALLLLLLLWLGLVLLAGLLTLPGPPYTWDSEWLEPESLAEPVGSTESAPSAAP